MLTINIRYVGKSNRSGGEVYSYNVKIVEPGISGSADIVVPLNLEPQVVSDLPIQYKSIVVEVLGEHFQLHPMGNATYER